MAFSNWGVIHVLIFVIEFYNLVGYKKGEYFRKFFGENFNHFLRIKSLKLSDQLIALIESQIDCTSAFGSFIVPS